ncbi:MAG: lysylphosphatidylglycerol synthase transmembrane domain-containing protein [Syntrophobacteraceae bacterium]|nr:flippase-like domain-containing protein [Desulfobacteraceae bacterium]
MAHRAAKYCLRLFISLTILALLLWKIGPEAVAVNFTRFKTASLILLNLTTLGAFLLSGLGLIVLGRSLNRALSWLEGMRGFLATASLSIFVPGRLGDLALLYYWERFLTREESLAVVVVDKIVTVSWVGLAGAAGLYAIFGGMATAASALCILPALVLAALFVSGERFPRLIRPTSGGRIAARVHAALASIALLLSGHRRAMLTTAAITGVRIFVYGFAFWIGLWGLDVDYPLLYAILATSLAQLTAILPISIMGLGVAESVCVYAVSRMQVDPGLALTAILAGRIITIFWMFLFFALFSLSGLSPRKTSPVRQPPSPET